MSEPTETRVAKLALEDGTVFTGRAFGADGTLYAHGTTTCLVFELPTQK